MSFNLVIVDGRLGKDVEVRATSSGKKVVNFSLASDYGYGDTKSTLWDTVVAWGPQADFCEKHLRKGSSVRVVGERRSRSWEDKTTGEKKYATEINATTIDFSGSPDNGQKASSRAPAATNARATTTPTARTQAAPEARAVAPSVDDIFSDDPF